MCLSWSVDLPAPASAVSRPSLQDHAELLEEEQQGEALLPGDTPSPAGEPALTQEIHRALMEP